MKKIKQIIFSLFALSVFVPQIVFGALTDNLTIYLPFNGDSNDEVSTHNGTDTSVSYSTGLLGNSAVFNGTSSKINFSDSTDFNAGTGAFTWSFWVYQTANTNYGTVLDLRAGDNGTANDFALMTNWGTDRYVVAYGAGLTGGFEFSALNDLPQNQWVHVVIVGNGLGAGSRGIKVYLDGVEIISDLGNYDLNLSKLQIGRNLNNASSFQGNIDEFGFWQRALDSNEISMLYNEGTGFTYPFTTSTPSSGGFSSLSTSTVLLTFFVDNYSSALTAILAVFLFFAVFYVLYQLVKALKEYYNNFRL